MFNPYALLIVLSVVIAAFSQILLKKAATLPCESRIR